MRNFQILAEYKIVKIIPKRNEYQKNIFTNHTKLSETINTSLFLKSFKIYKKNISSPGKDINIYKPIQKKIRNFLK